MQPDQTLDDDRLWLNYAEIYITNVCNLNCTNCNRFNNFNFTGHQRWDDYAEIYQRWAQLIDVKTIGVIGGEPMLNPDFPIWIDQVLALWTNSKVRVITNGTQLARWPGFYPAVRQSNGRLVLDVNIHGLKLAGKIHDDLRLWMHGPIDVKYHRSSHAIDLWRRAYLAIKDDSWPDCANPEDFDHLPADIRSECELIHRVSRTIWETEVYSQVWTDCNGVQAKVSMANSFNESSLRMIDHALQLQQSDPQKAVEVCYSKTCHHFIKGRLYKCGPVGLLPEAIAQFPVQVSAEDRSLIHSYQPAQADWPRDQLQFFVDDLKRAKAIPQCKFCPEQMSAAKFEAGTKKIKWATKTAA